MDESCSDEVSIREHVRKHGNLLTYFQNKCENGPLLTLIYIKLKMIK